MQLDRNNRTHLPSMAIGAGQDTPAPAGTSPGARPQGTDARRRMVEDMTSYMMRKHYCENDVPAVISLFEEPFSWFGAAEQEYAQGVETVSAIFRRFTGQVPRCNVTDEEYHVFALSPDIYFCTGRLWVTTDPSTGVYIRVHQRVTTIFRFLLDEPRCCHIHISNPYVEMEPDDVGFPTRMAQQSREYLQSQLEAQRLQIETQAAELLRLSYEDTLTGLHNRNRFNREFSRLQEGQLTRLAVACFDLNGLKEVNDRFGHLAGDDLIRRAGRQIQQVFPQLAYRVGGDEFVVLSEDLDRGPFEAGVRQVCRNMEREGISCSAGSSWRDEACNATEQLMEADQRMYDAKDRYYRLYGTLRQRPRRSL